jgi:hypothetical protein
MSKYNKEKENKVHTLKSILSLNMITDGYTIRMQMHMKMDVFCAPYIT